MTESPIYEGYRFEGIEVVSVRIEDLSKTYSGKKVLDSVSLELEDQQFSVLLGPPGAGKTTLLKILAGIEYPDEGRIFFDGKDITQLEPGKRNVAMIFQSFALYPHMKVYDNVAFPLKVMAREQDVIDKKVKDITGRIGISDLLDKYPRELSGGQAQRVAMCRALIKDAGIYLLDEPLTSVDYKIRETMRGELKRIFQKRGAIIYSTPDPLTALALGDKVVVMNKGVVEQSGPVLEVYHNPRTVYVGSYFGSPQMNLIEAKLIEKEDRCYFQSEQFLLEATHLKSILNESAYVLGLRPDKMRLHVGDEEGMVSMELEVRISEVVGSETWVHLKFSTARAEASREIVMYRPTLECYDLGTKIKVDFDPNDMYVYSMLSGKLISKYRRS